MVKAKFLHMNKSPVYDHILLDDHSATPKYQQLVNCIVNAIQDGKIKKDEILPSLSDLSIEFEISRDTAERGYKRLKDMGVLSSVPGKGYFIKSTEINQTLRIFLLFNKLIFAGNFGSKPIKGFLISLQIPVSMRARMSSPRQSWGPSPPTAA